MGILPKNVVMCCISEYWTLPLQLSESNKDFEDRIHELRQALQDSELNRQRQVRVSIKGYDHNIVNVRKEFDISV